MDEPPVIPTSLETRMSRDLVWARLDPLAPPPRLGRFAVLDKIGSGGMALVYAAYDPQLDRKVAIKLLRSDVAASDRGRERMLLEAKALAKLDHPNVVRVHEVGTVEDQIFVAMEFVRGATLRDWLVAEPRPWRRIVEAFLQAGHGVSAAHAAGIVHRDFKPANVLVGEDGRVRVVDFGLARALSSVAPESDGEPATALAASSVSHDGTLTESGAVLGTPAYMAPEQRKGLPADARSDQYSFCVALWEALAGERPAWPAMSTGPSAAGERPDASGRFDAGNMPAHVRRALRIGLEQDPTKRWPSMDALLAQLARDPARTRRRFVAVVAGVSVLGLVGYAQLGARDPETDPCLPPELRLHGTWDAASSARLHEAATGGDPADAAVISEALDRYAADWRSRMADVCGDVDGRVPSVATDPMRACLEGRRDELGVLVRLLTAGDDGAMEAAPRILRALRPVEACDEVSWVAAQAPTPSDRVVLEAQVRARLQGARVGVLVDRDDTGRALQVAQQTVEEARSSGDDLAVAEGLIAVTLAAVAARDGRIASASVEEATRLATQVGDAPALARAAALLSLAIVDGEQLRVRGAFLGHPDDGTRWLQQAEAALVRVPDPVGELRFRSARARSEPRSEKARADLEVVATLAATAYGESSGEHLNALVELAGVQYLTDDYPGALVTLKRARALARTGLAPATRTLEVLSAFARTHAYANDAGSARRILPALQAAIEGSTRPLARLEALAALGLASAEADDGDRVLDAWAQAIEQLDGAPLPAAYISALVRPAAMVLLERGDPEGALAIVARGLEVLERDFRGRELAENMLHSELLVLQADALHGLGRDAEARVSARRAVRDAADADEASWWVAALMSGRSDWLPDTSEPVVLDARHSLLDLDDPISNRRLVRLYERLDRVASGDAMVELLTDPNRELAGMIARTLLRTTWWRLRYTDRHDELTRMCETVIAQPDPPEWVAFAAHGHAMYASLRRGDWPRFEAHAAATREMCEPVELCSAGDHELIAFWEASAHAERGDTELAAKHLEEGRAYEPLFFDVGGLARHTRQAYLLAALGRIEDAIAVAEAAAARPTTAPLFERAELAIALGGYYARVGRTLDARAALEPALTLLEPCCAGSWEVTQARFTLAQLLDSAGEDRPRVLALARAAREGHAALGPGRVRERDEIDAWLRAREGLQ